MGRSPCCDKVGLKKGPWTPEEDQKLLAYIEEHGHGSWRALPAKAGLQRCGKSCRLRWTNYLRPDIKRGKFSLQEEQTIIQLHALLGNRWSAIATHLPKRTDNEIKNYWNTHLKKRLTKMGIDPLTHKPKNDALLSSTDQGNSKTASNLSHMAQWESARLEAEARLVRESKRRTNSHSSLQNHHLGTCAHFPSSNAPSSSSSAPALHKHDHALLPSSSSHSLDHAMKGWNNDGTNVAITRISGGAGDIDLESPTSTLSFSENNIAPPIMNGVIEFVGSSERGLVKEEGGQEWNKGYDQNSTHDLENSMPFTSTLHAMTIDATWGSADHDQSLRASKSTSSAHAHVIEQGFTNLLLNASSDHRSLSPDDGGESNNHHGSGDDGSNGNDFYEDNKNYWNSIFNLVNYSSPSDSSMF